MVILAIDPKFIIQSRSGAFGSSNEVSVEITNWNEIMKILKKIDEDWVKDLRKEFKSIGQESAKVVRKKIPSKSKPPLRNMKQVWFGRLAWGTTWGGVGGGAPKPAQSVLVQLPRTTRKKYRELERIPIVRLQVGSPGTVLYDMAYRRAGVKGRKGLTPEYDYIYRTATGPVPGKRRHRVVPGAFQKGIQKSTGKQASRIVWPAALDSLPNVTRRMNTVIYQANLKIQARLDRTK